jgi:secondary thiamine-phosphate synthase enzyme
MKEVSQQATGSLAFQTRGPGFVDISTDVAGWLDREGAGEGLVTVYIAHTSASLTIQENADPDVLRDLTDALERIAPRGHPYRHSSEGSDDMPSHIKSMVTSTSLTIPVRAGRMALGTWQGLYLVEHRDAAHRRRIELTFMGSER